MCANTLSPSKLNKYWRRSCVITCSSSLRIESRLAISSANLLSYSSRTRSISSQYFSIRLHFTRYQKNTFHFKTVIVLIIYRKKKLTIFSFTLLCNRSWKLWTRTFSMPILDGSMNKTRQFAGIWKDVDFYISKTIKFIDLVMSQQPTFSLIVHTATVFLQSSQNTRFGCMVERT